MFTFTIFVIITSMHKPVNEFLCNLGKELLIFTAFLLIRGLIICFWKNRLNKNLKNFLPDIVENLASADCIRISNEQQTIAVDYRDKNDMPQQHLFTTIPVYAEPDVKQPVLYISSENSINYIWVKIPG